MKKEDLPPANMRWGNPETEVLMSIQHPNIGGGPIQLIVDKRLASIRFENESEDSVTIIIEQKPISG